MYELNNYGENREGSDSASSIVYRRNVDGYQLTIETYFRSHLFPWLLLVLILNRNHWKRPVMLILILYWFLQCTGDHFQNYLDFADVDNYMKQNLEWPYTKYYWYVINCIAFVFWGSGEIIADWYPLLRTKAIVNDKKKLRPIYITCILFNISKLSQIIINFVYTPSTFILEDKKGNPELLRYKYTWWLLVVIVQVISLIYDIFVIMALKNDLFDRLESFKRHSENNFLEKFKQLSEFRIFISMVISIIFCPCAFIQFYKYVQWYRDPKRIKSNISDDAESFRVLALRFTYTFMYIDQILLRFYIKRNKSSYNKSNFSISKSNHSKSYNTIASIDSELLITSNAPNEIMATSSSSSISNSTYVANNNALPIYKNNYVPEQNLYLAKNSPQPIYKNKYMYSSDSSISINNLNMNNLDYSGNKSNCYSHSIKEFKY